MKWHVEFAKQATTFIDKNNISKEQIFYLIGEAIRNFQEDELSMISEK